MRALCQPHGGISVLDPNYTAPSSGMGFQTLRAKSPWRPASGESQYLEGVLVDGLYVEGFQAPACRCRCATPRRGKETVRYRVGPGGGGGGAPAGGGGMLEGAFAVLVQR